MGKRGTKTKPTALALVRGDSTAEKSNEPDLGVLEAQGFELCPPDWLDPSAHEPTFREVWDHYVPMLQKLNVVGAVDQLTLGAFCHSVVFYIRAAAAYYDTGTLTKSQSNKGNDDGRVRSPAATAWKQAAETMNRFAAELGLTPSSRAEMSNVPAGTYAGPNQWGNLLTPAIG